MVNMFLIKWRCEYIPDKKQKYNWRCYFHKYHNVVYPFLRYIFDLQSIPNCLKDYGDWSHGISYTGKKTKGGKEKREVASLPAPFSLPLVSIKSRKVTNIITILHR